MRLKEYLQVNELPSDRFAKAIGISRATFHNILRGHKDIRLSTAMRIVKATHGSVSYDDLANGIEVIKTYETQKKQGTYRKKVSVKE